MKKEAAELIKFLREDVIECDYHCGSGKCDKLTDLTNAFESSLSLVAGEEEVILQCQRCGATATAFYAKKYGCCTAPFPQRTSGICGGEFIVQAKVNENKKPIAASRTVEANELPEDFNIQSEVIKIHHQYGTTELANYRIQQLFEKYAGIVRNSRTVAESE